MCNLGAGNPSYNFIKYKVNLNIICSNFIILISFSQINCAGAWSNGPSLPNILNEGAVTECDNKIYGKKIIKLNTFNISAVDFYGGSNAIYQYNEGSNNWKQIGNVDYRRRFAAVASLNGGLYITGGLEYII